MNYRLAFRGASAVLLIFSMSCEKDYADWHGVIYGHAGAGISAGRYVYPPNTLESISYALYALDADAVEIDIRFTKDSQAIVFHDGDLENSTEGTGCPEEHTLAELQALNYHKRYHIPTLPEILELWRPSGKKLMLDVKVVNECASVAVDFNLANTALNSSFAVLSVAEKQRIVVNCRNYSFVSAVVDTTVLKSFETSDVDAAISSFNPAVTDMLVLKRTEVTSQQCELMRSEGIRFCLWSAISAADIKDAMALGPDEIIVDNVACAMKLKKK